MFGQAIRDFSFGPLCSCSEGDLIYAFVFNIVPVDRFRVIIVNVGQLRSIRDRFVFVLDEDE